MRLVFKSFRGSPEFEGLARMLFRALQTRQLYPLRQNFILTKILTRTGMTLTMFSEIGRSSAYFASACCEQRFMKGNPYIYPRLLLW